MQAITSYLIGVDVGTGSTKGVVADARGIIVTTAAVSHAMDVPRPGWAEMDPDMWWSDVCNVIANLLHQSSIDPASVSGIGVSAIGPCLLALDVHDRPLRPAILYGVDTRATNEIAELEESIGHDTIRELSGMDLSSQAIGPKIRWLRNNEPAVWARTCTITTASSYLVHRLTGRHVMDHHQACHVIPLYDPVRMSWTDRFADQVADPAMLPDLGWSDEIAGTLTKAAAEELGLAPRTPVIVGGVDAVQEALSVGVRSPGDLMIMYGSSVFMILVTEHRHIHPPLWCLPGAFADTWVLAAGMSTTGSATAWLRDVAGGTDGFGTRFRGAETVPPGANGLLFLPYLSGERTPMNDPLARGVIAGLSLAHTADDIFRSLLEGVGHGIRQNCDLIQSTSVAIERIFAVGGGASSDTWLQIVSDITGATQRVGATAPGASLGNAFMAGVATGQCTLDDLSAWHGPQREVVPNPSNRDRYERDHRTFARLYADTAAVVHELAQRID